MSLARKQGNTLGTLLFFFCRHQPNWNQQNSWDLPGNTLGPPWTVWATFSFYIIAPSPIGTSKTLESCLFFFYYCPQPNWIPAKLVSLAREHFGPPFLFLLSPSAQLEPENLVSLAREDFVLPILFLLLPPAQLEPAKPVILAREHFGLPFLFLLSLPAQLEPAKNP